jgi:hypothetical protein
MSFSPPPWPDDVTRGPGSSGPVDQLWRPPPAAPAPANPSAPALTGEPVPSPGAPLPASSFSTVPAKPAWHDVAAPGGLLLLCVGVHVAAMFPAYTGSPVASVVSLPYELAEYICLTVGWLVAAMLVLSRLSVRGGVALGIGVAAIELGFLISDLAGSVQVSNRITPGIWLGFAALGLGGAGVLLGASIVPTGSPRLRPFDQAFSGRAAVTVLVAALAVAAFLPSWDKYQVVNSAGHTTTVTLGNAFAQPAGVMAGELVAALAIGAIAILGAFWAPPAVGAWMTAGVVFALSSQLISAAVQVSQAGAVTVDGQPATMSLTWFWAVDVGAAVALAGLALWSGLASRKARPGRL